MSSIPHKSPTNTALRSFKWRSPAPVHRRTTNHQSSVTNSANTPCEVPWYDRAYHERQAGAARGSNQEGGKGGGRRETIRCPPLPQCDHRDCVRTRESYSWKSAARFKVSLTLCSYQYTTILCWLCSYCVWYLFKCREVRPVFEDKVENDKGKHHETYLASPKKKKKNLQMIQCNTHWVFNIPVIVLRKVSIEYQGERLLKLCKRLHAQKAEALKQQGFSEWTATLKSVSMLSDLPCLL